MSVTINLDLYVHLILIGVSRLLMKTCRSSQEVVPALLQSSFIPCLKIQFESRLMLSILKPPLGRKVEINDDYLQSSSDQLYVKQGPAFADNMQENIQAWLVPLA